MKTRREFIGRSAALLAAAASGRNVLAAARKPLRLLILGGTRFIGLHMTAAALAHGHSVAFFNRGKTRTDLFPKVERFIGDRNGQLDALKGRSFDAVIDDSGYVPRHVRLSAQLLAANVPHYVFISSVSVYPDFAKPRAENAAVGKLKDENSETVTGENYGPLKALCEQEVRRVYGEHATILRPGLIVGPDDNTDRFTYWPARAARGGDFAAPGKPTDAIQFIDARDLAAFTLRCIEHAVYGTYNVVTPPRAVTMGALIDACVQSAIQLAHPAVAPKPQWLPASFLETQKVQPWSDMPVWLPASGDDAAFADTPSRRAQAAGLRWRPVAETVRDTLAWHLTRPAAERDAMKAGLSPAREAALLAAWRAQGRPK